MAIFLKFLFEEICQAQDEEDLRSRLGPQIGEYFVAKRSGIFFFEQLKTNPRFQKILDLGRSIEQNPVARYVAERHAPVHEALVTSPKAWAIICPRPDHWHVMAGPIISQGQLIGAVGCTREKSMPAFDTQNLADMSAICLHLSVWTATMRMAPNAAVEMPSRLFSPHRLTAREWQIADLVALGRTNAEIGKELWITENSVKQALKRMFRKLEVSSRAAMIARIASGRNLVPESETPALN